MMEDQDVFSYIETEKAAWKTTRIPLTESKDWNMYEHIQRCRNVANAWFHSGKNDGLRPYNDIVSPIIDVAFRTEGFNVTDIVPFVNDPDYYYKSFLVKKYHPQWARKHELDTFIDEVVENSIIYDLALVKDVNGVRPEVVDLASIAFCDQTDVIAGPLCLEHNYTVSDLVEMKGKWDDDAIDQAIVMSQPEKSAPLAGEQKAKTPGKYITAYELRGRLPERWLNPDADRFSYTDQMHIVCYYTDKNGKKGGITLFKGVDKPLRDRFKALKIDTVRSRGRACGRSIVERLFEPQVWANYAGIKLKDMLDGAVDVFITDSDQIGNKKLKDIKTNQVLKQERGATTTRLNSQLQNVVPVVNYQLAQESSARALGSASESSLGKNPVSGTPFSLQALIVQQGEGIHQYRQGKIATFFADVLYRDLILKYLVKDMNAGKTFSDELTFDELQEVADIIASNYAEAEMKEKVLEYIEAEIESPGSGTEPTMELKEQVKALKKEEFLKGGTRRFLEVVKDELKDLPVDVMVNITGKQRLMAENADKITNIIRAVMQNPAAFQQIPGLTKTFNELLEESGMSPIDFSSMVKAGEQPVPTLDALVQNDVPTPVTQ